MEKLLAVAGLTRRYGAVPALVEVDLRLAEGDRHAVIGPNGAGKSTLLHLIAGTLRPSAGRVVLSGRDVTRASAATRARLGITRTFQTPALAGSLTVLDNLVIGAWRRTPGGARWWPRRHRQLAARCLHLLDRLGLTGVADRPAGTLPHGTRRLVELAVALAGRPRLLLLDEPAAGLTGADLPRLVACLRSLPKQVAVLMVEHHLDVVAALADTVTVLHHGRVLARGTPHQVARDPVVAEVYLGTGG